MLNSEHDAFVVEVVGEPVPAVKNTLIDTYADAFEAFEKGECDVVVIFLF